MPLNIHLIPAFQDNYIFILHAPQSNKTAVVDPGNAQIVIDWLEKNNLQLDYILNTHHHHDHTGGNLILKQRYKCKIYGPAKENIPGLDVPLLENDTVLIGQSFFSIIDVGGHTKGHIAFFEKEEHLLFCGDALFAMGCGRIFEGTPKQMFDSLQKIKKLPDDTKIYCAHEYTLHNSYFALTAFPNNIAIEKRQRHVIELREKNQSTIPTTLAQEKETNPFLLASNLQEFTKLRKEKDCF